MQITDVKETKQKVHWIKQSVSLTMLQKYVKLMRHYE